MLTNSDTNTAYGTNSFSLIKAVQELSAQVQSLQKQLNNL